MTDENKVGAVHPLTYRKVTGAKRWSCLQLVDRRVSKMGTMYWVRLVSGAREWSRETSTFRGC